MTPFLLLLCLGGDARDPLQVLADHGAALGPIDSVTTLAARSVLDDRQGTRVEGVETDFRIPGECLRRFPSNRMEFFCRQGAFVYQGSFERYRPGQRTTRAGYHLLAALAEPFPLREFLLDAGKARSLRSGQAEGHEVLVAPLDAYGLHRVFLLDPKTHLLSNLRIGEAEAESLVNITYEDYRPVKGVMLPHRIVALAHQEREDPAEKRFLPVRSSRFEQVISWETGTPPPAAFEPGGLGGGSDERFQVSVFPTGPDPFSAAAGDVDGDGRTDIAVACDRGLFVHFGGAEASPVFVPLGEGRHGAVVVEDFDFDGRAEVAVHSNLRPANTVHFVPFGADRKPGAARRLTVQTHFASRLVARDLDLDGLADLLLTGFASRNLEIRFGNGCGGFRVTGSHWPLDPRKEDRRGYGIAVGRADADVHYDLAVADGRRVVLFQGNDRLGFLPTSEIEAGPRPVDVAFADLDRDGRDDLVVLNDHPLQDMPFELRILHNTGKGFQERMQADAGGRGVAMAVGDFSGDGVPDVATASFLSGEVRVRYGDGEGKLSASAERYASGRGTSFLVAADLDRDGREDLVAVNRVDDSIALLRNRTGPAGARKPEPRARLSPPPVTSEFVLEGLTDTFSFEGEFRLPKDLPEPSGLAFFSGDGVHAQFFAVSDEKPRIWRLTLDRAGKRLLVSPPIPLSGLEGRELDLEGVAVDHDTGTLLLASEADASVIWTTSFGTVLGTARTMIEHGQNDGLEALAFLRRKDGSPRIYAFRERIGMTLQQPPVRVFSVDTAPDLRLTMLLDTVLPRKVADQTDACWDGESLLVVSRIAREILEVRLDGDGFAPDVKSANYRALVDGRLALFEPRTAIYGNVEGIARDLATGDLLLAVDNNNAVVGQEGRNRGDEGRILWFSSRSPRAAARAAGRVAVRQLLVTFKGAKGAVIERTREEAAALAARLEREARAGADFETLAREHNDGGTLFPVRFAAAEGGVEGESADFRRANLPRGLARAAFDLAVGEIALVEYHEEDSPYGWHLVLRTE